MTLEQFKKIHESYRASKPKLFLMADRLATLEDIEQIETQFCVCLPPSYREFLIRFGGGVFGFINIFSLDPESDYYLPLKRLESLPCLPADVLPFSDDYAGGWYVFKHNGVEADEAVRYWNTDGGLVDTEFRDIFEFIARYAYEPA